jgi:hypothetical protein
MALLTQTRALMSDACRSPLAARHAHHARFEPGAMSNEPIVGPVVISQYIVPKKGEQKILVKNKLNEIEFSQPKIIAQELKDLWRNRVF